MKVLFLGGTGLISTARLRLSPEERFYVLSGRNPLG
jgi:hypothetical protein